MRCYPAIDVREGRCVRLLRGDFDAETVYGDPVAVARGYAAAGAEWLHVVDLDAALTGAPRNRDVVLAIAAAVDVPVQAGGGVRDGAAAQALLAGGVARVVVGTAVAERPTLLAELAERYPGRVAAGLDHRRDGEGRRSVVVRGWIAPAGLELERVVERLSELPLAALVVTDVTRDGTLQGPDLAGLAVVLGRTPLPLVASGGVGSLADLEALASLSAAGRRLEGVVVGRALLAGAFTLEEAIAACGP